MYDDDKKLARRVLKGDRSALQELFDQYYASTYRFCLRRVAVADAEEIATDTIRQAIRRLETYRGEAKLMSWILGIARNQLASHFRKTKKHENVLSIEDNDYVRSELESMSAELSDSPEFALERTQREYLVHLMLDYLPADYGRVLEWKYIEGLSVDEIAGRLSTTKISVQSKLARARRAFQHTFANMSNELAEQLNVYSES